MLFVVDTNVPVVANGKSEQASSSCVMACAKQLEELKNIGKLVIDDQWRIVKEYIQNLRSEGQPGVGDEFLKWVLTNWKNPHRCELVSITPFGTDQSNFEEFPSDPRLCNFDPSDRKFVAVSLAHAQRPPILQSVDRKWWEVREILKENGVEIEFLCEMEVKQSRKKKSTYSKIPPKISKVG